MHSAWDWHQRIALTLLCVVAGFTLTTTQLRAEGDDTPYSSDIDAPPPPEEIEEAPTPRGRELKPKSNKEKSRKYFVPDPNRSDAGIFHVAFVVGGNFYIEPQLSAVTRLATGDYFKDFGFQGGFYFDYDYSALTENVPLGLRGSVLYKYILDSVNVFDLEGIARYMFRVSDKSTFGLGAGVSIALWYRSVTATSPDEETILLPSFILEAGFEFNPFMVDFKWLINRLGGDSTIMGLELYFGLRL